MRLRCENIGKLTSADVEIKAVTLIAGLNSTGKSTVGKLLYCVFNSFYNFSEQASMALKNFISNQLYELSSPIENIEGCVAELYTLRYGKDIEKIRSVIAGYTGNSISGKKNASICERILELLNLSDDDLYKWILQSKFSSEFGAQIQNIFTPGKPSSVTLTIKNSDINIEIKNDKISTIENARDLKTEVVYIDDPFILDNLATRLGFFWNSGEHKAYLQRKLMAGITKKFDADTDMDAAIQDLLTKKQLKAIYDKLDSVCKGNIVQEPKTGFAFKLEGTNKTLSIKNLSTGLKTFSIIKTLLINGALVQNGTIILDEPEIHLHPEWQKLLAEVIILIQKEFNMHILINSHSPYFINAIDVYAEKHGIRDTCKFYLATGGVDSNTSELVDVSNDLEPINKLLYIPLQELENERAEINMGGDND